MDVGTTGALLHFVVIVVLWIVLPLIPAWLTFRITPDQSLGLKGPLQGMTLRATGSFGAYTVVLALLSAFVWPMGKSLIERAAGSGDYQLRVISGQAAFYDLDGKPAATPNLRAAYITIKPPVDLVDTQLSLKVPFRRGEKPIIYIQVPDWGGGIIPLQDIESYTEDPVTGTIKLKDIVQIRQQPTKRLSVGEL